MAETDTHDRDLGGLHQLGKRVNGLGAVSWIAGSVGDEDTVKVMSNLVDWVVIREDGHTGSTANETSENVLFHSAVDDGNVGSAVCSTNVKGRLGADLTNKVDLLRVDEGFVLVGIILFTDSDSSERRSLFTEIGDNLTGINARDGRDTLSDAPLAQTLDSSPVAVLESGICNDDADSLKTRGFEVLEKTILVTFGRRDAIVADKRLGKDKDLATV